MRKNTLLCILESLKKLCGVSTVIPKAFLISKGLKKPVVKVAIVCAPPVCDKKSIEKPSRKEKAINSV